MYWHTQRADSGWAFSKLASSDPTCKGPCQIRPRLGLLNYKTHTGLISSKSSTICFPTRFRLVLVIGSHIWLTFYSHLSVQYVVTQTIQIFIWAIWMVFPAVCTILCYPTLHKLTFQNCCMPKFEVHPIVALFFLFYWNKK